MFLHPPYPLQRGIFAANFISSLIVLIICPLINPLFKDKTCSKESPFEGGKGDISP